jgi:membrane associated rhomboid family serine protease
MRDAAVGHQCPECVSEGRRTTRPVRTAFGGSAAGTSGYATIALIGINVMVALATLVSAGRGDALAGGGFGGLLGSATPLHLWGGLIPDTLPLKDSSGQVVDQVAGVAHGGYYRLLTSMFLHFGIVHLLMNMWALWVLGRILEAALGPLRFLALYLVAGLGGSVAVYYFSDPHGLSAGASGAIFGLFGALIVVLRRLGRSTASVLPILLVNLVFTFAVPGISIAAHLGGLVTGAAAAAGLAYAPRQVRTLVQIAVIAGLGLLLVVLTLTRTATFALS